MLKTILWSMLGIFVVTMALETPPAYAIFGTRIARKVIAARHAEDADTSDDAAKTAPQVRNDEKPRTFGNDRLTGNE